MQENPLTSKVALITGAARRIGADIARTLHAAGMNIVIHYHTSHDAATQLCADLNQKRAKSAVTLRADLLDIDGLKAVVSDAEKAWKRLDVLVNNASRFYRTILGDVTQDIWDDLQNSNLKAAFFLSQYAAPHLAANQGNIVNITDIHGERPLRDYSVYCIAKSGLLMLTKVLARELGPSIRVNAVSPGPIAWPEGENTLSEAEKNKIIHETSLLRHGDPHDIAKAVLFFIRDGGYVTGQILAVDGGRTVFG